MLVIGSKLRTHHQLIVLYMESGYNITFYPIKPVQSRSSFPLRGIPGNLFKNARQGLNFAVPPTPTPSYLSHAFIDLSGGSLDGPVTQGRRVINWDNDRSRTGKSDTMVLIEWLGTSDRVASVQGGPAKQKGQHLKEAVAIPACTRLLAEGDVIY